MSHVGCANRLGKKKEKKRKKKKRINIVLTRNGNLIPVYGTGRAKVDYSVLTVCKCEIVQKGNGGKNDFDVR